MFAKVTEGKVMEVRGTGRGSHGNLTGRLSLVVSMWTALSMGAIAWAQAGEGDEQPFRVTIRDMSDNYQQVLVPLGRSILVETSIETARADVIAGNIVDVQPISPTQLLLTGKAFGTTQVILWSESDRRSMLEVTVELDVRALTEELQAVDPQGDIRVRSVMGNIVLTGTISGADKAAEAVDLANLFLPPQARESGLAGVRNHLHVAGEQQVLLRCIVAEVSRSAARQLGVNGFLAGENFQDMFAINNLGGINPSDIGVSRSVSVTDAIPFLTGLQGIPVTASPTVSLGFPRVQMQLFLKALSDNSLLKILAEPNLVCISGETASFLAGGEFPIPVPQGIQAVTIEFREFGVRLNFTPVVNAHQRIRLRVRPEISETDFSNAVQVGGIVVPGLTNRSVETTVEIGSGQTIAIAGLLSEEVKAFASRIPGIGDLPVLGALFRSVDFRRELTELVILVTPEIVAPLDPHQVGPLPGQFMIDPTDFEFYALGLLEGRPGNTRGKTEGEEGEADASTATDPNSLAIRGPWGFEGE